MLYAPISAGASGANAVVAAVPGKKVRVVAGILSFSGTVNAKFQSAGTDITGLYYGAAGVVVPFDFADEAAYAGQQGHFETNQGEALNLNLSGATAVGGHIAYVLVP